MQSQKSLAYPKILGLEEEFRYVGLLARNQSFVSPSGGENGYKAGQQIIFELPNSFLDLRKSFLQFTLTGTPGTGSTYNRYNYDIRSIIQRITVQASSKVIYDIDNWNILNQMLNYLEEPNLSTTIGQLSYGQTSQVQRDTDFLNSNKYYAVPLYHMDNDFFHTILPLQKLAATIKITIYLAQPDVCIESDGTNPSFTVNNCQYHYNLLVADQNFDENWDEKVKSGKLTMSYETYSNYNATNLLLAGTSKATQSLTFKYNNLLGVMVAMRNSSSVFSLTTNNKQNIFNFNDLQDFRLRINSQSYPQDSSRLAIGDLYFALLEMFGLSGRNAYLGGTNYNSTSFIGGIPLSLHPYERESGGDIGGISSVLGTSILCDFQFGTPLANSQTVDFFSLQTNTLTFLPNGTIQWSE